MKNMPKPWAFTIATTFQKWIMASANDVTYLCSRFSDYHDYHDLLVLQSCHPENMMQIMSILIDSNTWWSTQFDALELKNCISDGRSWKCDDRMYVDVHIVLSGCRITSLMMGIPNWLRTHVSFPLAA